MIHMRRLVEKCARFSENDAHQKSWDASIVETSPDDFDSSSILTKRDVSWQASVCEHTSRLTLFLNHFGLANAQYHSLTGAV